MKLTPIQMAAAKQSYEQFIEDSDFEDAILTSLRDGKTPEQIAREFRDFSAVEPGHRKEFERRLLHAALYLTTLEMA